MVISGRSEMTILFMRFPEDFPLSLQHQNDDGGARASGCLAMIKTKHNEHQTSNSRCRI